MSTADRELLAEISHNVKNLAAKVEALSNRFDRLERAVGHFTGSRSNTTQPR
jgi:outer membrane murein-binding lipoprotein Lpp